MLMLGAAFLINDYTDLETRIDTLRSIPEKLTTAANIARSYVNNNRGASKEIVKFLFH
jgi:hypothetical protein